jgi:hypothetical protein
VRAGSWTANNVYVRDILPSNLFYMSGSTTVEGSTVVDGITSSGINIGYLYAGQQKIIKFRAVLAKSANFSVGTTNLTNNVEASSNNAGTVTAQLPISVNKGTAPIIPQVITGGGTIMFAGILSTILAGGLLFYGQTYFARKRVIGKVIAKQQNDKDKLNFI